MVGLEGLSETVDALSRHANYVAPRLFLMDPESKPSTTTRCILCFAKIPPRRKLLPFASAFA